MPLFAKLKAFFSRRKLDAEMSEEMLLHLEQRTREAIAAGLQPEEARAAALRRFGGVEQAKERCRDEQQRGLQWLDHLGRDVRVGARVLLKDKVFLAVAVIVLALGIGAVTAQFSVINSALIRGLPFPDSDQLVRIAVRDPSWAPGRNRNVFSRDYLDWSRDQRSFTSLTGIVAQGSFIVTIRDVPQRIVGAHVHGPFFSLLGVKPALGRDFTDEDQGPSAPRVAIISDALWRGEFGADPAILGRSLRLNGRAATIVGVMPPGFSFPREQMWMPMFNELLPPSPDNVGPSVGVMGRLKPGVTLDQATSELTTLVRRSARDYPKSNRDLTEVFVEPLLNNFVPRDTRQVMGVMGGAVAAVLLIACLNVMNMQLARAALRARELAVRGALGASRARLVTQMLVESLLVALAGGAAGVFVAIWALKLYTAGATGLPAWMQFALDPRVLLFTAGATGATVILSGLLPAFLASRTNSLDVLKVGGRGQTNPRVNRIAGGLVVGQIALTSALLVASLVLVKSVANRYALDFGYPLDSVLAGRMNFSTEYRTGESALAIQRRILDQLRSLPQFAQAAFSTRRNSLLTGETREIFLEAREEARAEVWAEFVSDGYFATLGLKPIEGREFEPTDTPDRPIPALVNASFARKFLAGGPALGRRLRLNNNNGPWLTIVGVVPDTLLQGPMNDRGDSAGIFVPSTVFPTAYLTLVVRGRGGVPPAELAEPLRREIARLDPNLAIYVVETPQNALHTMLTQVRTVTHLFAIFGLVAIVLAAVGLYGVAAFAVNQRTHEFGIRMALGAAPQQIVEMILRQGLRRLALGGVAGLALAFALARVASTAGAGLLYNVSPRDPAIYLLVLGLLTLATLLACLIPARRATRVDPMIALRAE